MSQLLLGIHILGALGSLCIAVLAVRSVVAQTNRVAFYSRALSGTFIINVLSGLLLSVSTQTAVISICDNLALYAVLFVSVQLYMLYRARKLSRAPLFTGVLAPAFFTVLVLLNGF